MAESRGFSRVGSGGIDKGRSELRLKLRRWQLRAAERGSVAMLIFLGKAMLGQREDGSNGEADHVEVILNIGPNEPEAEPANRSGTKPPESAHEIWR